MEGVAAKQAVLDRYNELAMNYSDETADEMTQLQDEIEAKGLWDLDSKVDQAMDALRCPPDDWAVDKLSGGEKRRVALCKLLLWQPRTAAARRADQPPRCRDHRLARKPLRNYPGAILIVTHDRYFLDNVTSWILELDRGQGIPYEGNYTSWLGRSRSGWRWKAARKPRARRLEPKGVDAGLARRPVRPRARPASSATTNWSPSRTPTRAPHGADHHPHRRAAGQQRGRFRPACPRAFRTSC
jgi:ATPase subunit of ABC transporter with duplicated ATPase domains